MERVVAVEVAAAALEVQAAPQAVGRLAETLAGLLVEMGMRAAAATTEAILAVVGLKEAAAVAVEMAVGEATAVGAEVVLEEVAQAEAAMAVMAAAERGAAVA